MARSRWTDFLSDHLFWAMDVSAVKAIPIFTPLFGFSGISAPKIQVELETFNDGTFIYPRHVVKRATVSEVTFTRAASLYDSDFYDWIYYAIYGTNAAKDASSTISTFLGDSVGTVRRTILMFHFARINLSDTSSTIANTLAASAETALFAGLAGGSPAAVGAAAIAGGVTSALGANIGFSMGPVQFATWLPARAWLLHDCIPTSYSAGSDFDANSGAISLMNLTVQPEWIEEYSMGVSP